MTKAEIVQEIIDRGYDYIKSSRIGEHVDRAYRQVCSRHPWPFLEEDKTGTAPLAFTDLSRILSVKDTTVESEPRGMDRAFLVATYPNLTDTGAPLYWYLEDETLSLYPVSEDSLAVRYIKKPTALGDTDEPLVPEEWQYLLVDLAVADCLKDDDEYAEARALRGETLQAVDAEMYRALFGRNLQNGQMIERTGSFADYL